MTAPLTSAERLALELEKLTGPKIPPRWIERVRNGYFHDFYSPIESPKQDLYLKLKEAGHIALADRVAQGEFDETAAEAREWLRTPDARQQFKEMFPSVTWDKWKELFGL